MAQCKQCQKPIGDNPRKKFCNTLCGNNFRYQNDKESRERSKASSTRYRDANRETVNEYFRNRKSTRVELVEQNIYWAIKYADHARKVELAHDILDMRIGHYHTAIVEDFLVEMLEDE